MLRETYIVFFYVTDPDQKEFSKTEIALLKYQVGNLEEQVDATHKTLEQDINVFVNDVDRSPFYKYKSKLVGQMVSLK